MESVHRGQVRVGGLPALVLGSDLLERGGELGARCRGGLEGVEDSAALGLQMDRVLLGEVLVLVGLVLEVGELVVVVWGGLVGLGFWFGS